MNNLRNLRIAKGYTQNDIAVYLGISSPAYGYYETGKRQMTVDTARKLAKYFKVPISLLIGDDEAKDDVYDDLGIKIPVVGQISAGLPILATQNIENYEFAPTNLIKNGYNYFYLRVRGDSMNLLFQDGNIVLIEQTTEIENNEIGAFLIDNENATVKKYHRKKNIVVLNPMSTNPIHKPQIYDLVTTPVSCIGRVVAYQGIIKKGDVWHE